MKKICLCMIVKNEAHIIKRCLESVRDFIDYWVIVDTGSTDNTKQIIEETMNGVPGELHDVPWKNFSYNRNESLRLAQDKSDYSLIMDADELITFEAGFDKDKFKEDLSLDVYYVQFRDEINNLRAVLTKNSLSWRYKGVIHEFPINGAGQACEDLPVKTSDIVYGLYQSTLSDGARSLDPNKYVKDAETIKEALKTEMDPLMVRRYTFYLAQCYRDSGAKELSLKRYLERSTLGGWNEEIFFSLYSAGQLAVELGKPEEQVLSLFFRAFETAPWRTESVHAAVFYLREKEKFGLGYLLAKGALDIPKPDLSCLFLRPSIYDYALLDEYCVCAYYIMKYKECHDGCDKLLKSGLLPSVSVDRVKMNMNFCVGKF